MPEMESLQGERNVSTPVCARKQTNGPPAIDQGFSKGSCDGQLEKQGPGNGTGTGTGICAKRKRRPLVKILVTNIWCSRRSCSRTKEHHNGLRVSSIPFGSVVKTRGSEKRVHTSIWTIEMSFVLSLPQWFSVMTVKLPNLSFILQIWVTWASKITIKIFSSVASKLREATPPVTSVQPLYTQRYCAV